MNFVLESSSREQIDALPADLLIEEVTRVYGRTYLYQPNDAQIKVHRSTAAERWIFGGNGLGKDAALVNETIWHALGNYPDYYPEQLRIAHPSIGRYCTTNFNDGILGIVLPELEKWSPPGSFKFRKDERLIHWRNGSLTQLKSFDQDIQSFSGQTLHYCHVSEHMQKEQYDESKARLRGYGPRRFFGCLTPKMGMTFEYNEIYEAFEQGLRKFPELEVFRGSTYENIVNLGEKYLLQFEHLRSDEKRRALYGDFIALTGLVYPEYRDWRVDDVKQGDTHGGHLIEPFEIPKDYALYMAIDPHPRKSFAMLWCAVSPDGDHIYYDEFYAPPDSGYLVKDYADIIREKEGDRHYDMRARIIDCSARANNPITGTDIQQELARNGIVTRSTRKGDKDIIYGINAVRKGLQFTKLNAYDDVYRPKIFVFDTLKRLRYEFRNYCYDYKTEVLTNEGWKLFKDLNRKESVATLNSSNWELEYQFPYNYIEYFHSGDMLFFDGKTVNFCVTPDHKFYAANKNRGKEFKKEGFKLETIDGFSKVRFSVKRNADHWKGRKIDTFNIYGRKIPMDDWLKFLGLYLAEGHSHNVYKGNVSKGYHEVRSNQVTISQYESSKYFEIVKNIIGEMPFDFKYDGYKFYTCNKALHDYLHSLGKSHDKHIPYEFKQLSRDLLKCLLYGLMIGDGTIYDPSYGKNNRYNSVSKVLIDDVQEISLKIGSYGSIYSGEDSKGKKYFQFIFCNKQGFSKIYGVKKIRYSGKVYCVSVPNRIIYVRRNGKSFWCGNCWDDWVTRKDMHDVKERPMKRNDDLCDLTRYLENSSLTFKPIEMYVLREGRFQTMRKTSVAA